MRRRAALFRCRCSCCSRACVAPLWLARVGLYQYLALEIMIWMLFALGYNLLLGYGGLPSFGHGAFFGIGAYAFGLLAASRLAQPVVRSRAARC
jgi:ABC-type branched-subunit amino acid transport system permease subunit